MARLLRIERAVTWIARALTANRDAFPVPEGIVDQILPVVDIFGTQRLASVQVASVIGDLAAIEVFHEGPDEENLFLYLSVEYSHDDPIARRLRPGRIVPTSAGFPFASFRDEELQNAGEFLAARSIWIGPGHRLAVQANAMAAAARMTMTVVWMEMPIGEYTQARS